MKSLTEKLTLFCKPDSDRCKYPWKNDGYIYGSDTTIIIRIPDNGEEFPVNTLRPIDSRGLGWEIIGKGTPVEISAREFKERFLADCICTFCTTEGERGKCPECEGEGSIYFINSYHEYEWVCSTCHGEGFLGKYKTSECPFCNGTEILRKNVRYNLSDSVVVDVSLILRLTTVFGDLKLYPGEKLSPIGFTFEGGDGLFMPLSF